MVLLINSVFSWKNTHTKCVYSINNDIRDDTLANHKIKFWRSILPYIQTIAKINILQSYFILFDKHFLESMMLEYKVCLPGNGPNLVYVVRQSNCFSLYTFIFFYLIMNEIKNHDTICFAWFDKIRQCSLVGMKAIVKNSFELPIYPSK